MIDHLVYAAPDLAAAVADLAERFGVAPSPGGRHLGLGTRNYLADLGGGAFLEVIGPDPEQPEPAEARPFGVDFIPGPRLLTWAARVDDLDASVASARERGVDAGSLSTMSRLRDDGVRISWRLAVPADGRQFAGLVPFLVDWGDSARAGAGAAPGLRLVSLIGRHADPELVQRRLAALSLDDDLTIEPVGSGESAGLRAVIETLHGRQVLS